MFFLLTCYVTVFLLLLIITLRYGRRVRYYSLLLALLFFTSTAYLALETHHYPFLLLGLLLYLLQATVGGFLVDGIQKRGAVLEKTLSDYIQRGEKIRQREEERDAFLENTPDILYRLSLKPDLHFDYCSPGMEEYTGFTQQKIHKNPGILSQVLLPGGLSLLQDLQANRLSPKVRLTLGLRHRTKQSITYLECHHFPIYDAKGELVAVSGIARDISASLAREKRLREAYRPWKEEEIFRHILHLLQDDRRSIEENLQEMVERIPRAFPALSGVAAQISHGGGFWRSQDPLPEEILFSVPLQDGGQLSIFQEKDPEKTPLCSVEEDFFEFLAELVETFLNRKRAEQALYLKIEEQSRLFDSLHIQIWTMMDPKTYGQVNRAHGDFFHLAAPEMEGQNMCSLLSPMTVDTLTEGNGEVFQTEKFQYCTHWIYNGEGEQRLLYLVKSPGPKIQGQLSYIICYAYDLTQETGALMGFPAFCHSLLALFQLSPCGIIIQDKEGKLTGCNQAAQNIFGCSEEEMRQRGPSLLSFGETEGVHQPIQQALTGKTIQGQEYTWCRRDGSQLHIQLFVIPFLQEGGAVFGVLSILFDVTKERQALEKSLYLDQHDQRTGLYNRDFMEREIKRLEQEGQVPITVIIGDVNGLRLINDAFGHAQGNRVLLAVAELLQEICRGEDLIGRWGADEFILLLSGITAQEAERICSRLHSADLGSHFPIPISLVFTTQTKTHPGQNLRELIRSTEDLLYKEHQDTIQSARDLILANMVKMLSSVSDETEEHTWRMQWLALEMGECINLSEMEMERLSLLVTLHDIGKITIDKQILVKEEVCSVFDWKRVKTHCEAGYLIARSSEAFAHVADAIMAHHEWWDGSGYPKGQRGGEIPIISRIIAIIDAYDTMAYKRRYRKKLTRKEALLEIEKGRGTQFDPHLTDVFLSIMNRSNLEEHREGILPARPMTAQQQLESSYEQIQALSRRLLHAREEELSSMARDLHDDIGQNLTAIKLDMELLNSEISSGNTPLKRRMEATIDLVDSVIEHIRQQISAMRPPVLDDMGLLVAIKGIIKRYQGVSGMEMVLRQQGMDQRFSREVETVLYRCVQESLTNVVRHSQANRVELDLFFDKREITTRIWDNGCGFHLESLEISADHIGLTGMKERVQLINGNITILSEPGEGTEIFISVPVN